MSKISKIVEEFKFPSKDLYVLDSSQINSDKFIVVKSKKEDKTYLIKLEDITASDGISISDVEEVIYKEVTYAEAQTLIEDEELVPGATYKITDRGDLGIWLKAISTTEFEKKGTRLMLCPVTYYNGTTVAGNVYKGVYHPNMPSVDPDDRVIHGGLVFKNLDNGMGSSVNGINLLSDTEWELLPKDEYLINGAYEPVKFDVLYDFRNDWIEQQSDGNGNIVGISWAFKEATSFPINPVDVTDWNISNEAQWHDERNHYLFFNNKVPFGIINNRLTNGGLGMTGNTCNIIRDNCVAYILYNDLDTIYNNYSVDGLKGIRSNVGKNFKIQGNIFDDQTYLAEVETEGIAWCRQIGDIKDNYISVIKNCVTIGDISSNGSIDTPFVALNVRGTGSVTGNIMEYLHNVELRSNLANFECKGIKDSILPLGISDATMEDDTVEIKYLNGDELHIVVDFSSTNLETGSPLYITGIPFPFNRITEMCAIGTSIADDDDQSATVSVGIEVDDEEYLSEISLTDLNAGYKRVEFSQITSNPWRRIKIDTHTNNLVGGTLKLQLKFL